MSQELASTQACQRIIVATGSYIGEGFDDSRLDTLFLAMPISWRGTLRQYVGRLHRLHDGKKVVEVYDYVDSSIPMLARMVAEFRRFPAVLGEDRIFPPKQGAKGQRQRVEGSFETILEMAGIEDFRFHDLRHTFASWYMMNGGDLYELAKILGHSNIKMTERYAKLAKTHLAKTGNTARQMWKLMEGKMGSEIETGA
jgi:integrase